MFKISVLKVCSVELGSRQIYTSENRTLKIGIAKICTGNLRGFVSPIRAKISEAAINSYEGSAGEVCVA
jgi:hypothetical protein